MDLIAISTAGVLLAILTAWYALLEYEERRQRKDVERSNDITETGGRTTASHERSQDAGVDFTQHFRRSNGSHPPSGMSSAKHDGRRRVFRAITSGYGLAVVSVLLAYLFVTSGNFLFRFPPLIFFGAAVAFTFTFAGRAPGLLAFILSTLLSDFFFVKPTFTFSLDWQVFRLSVFYLLGGLLSVFISKRSTSPPQTH
jgi:hypothetical protein